MKNKKTNRKLNFKKIKVSELGTTSIKGGGSLFTCYCCTSDHCPNSEDQCVTIRGNTCFC